jgi:hypothetical protein
MLSIGVNVALPAVMRFYQNGYCLQGNIEMFGE